jgi:hypothetical protein
VELRQIARSKGVEIARVLGPDEKPVRLIIRGSRIKIAELRELFSNDCIFEEDRRLRPA